MSPLRIAAAQSAPIPIGTPSTVFEQQALAILDHAPDADLLVFPELHLFGGLEHDDLAREAALGESAVQLDGALVSELFAIARRLGVWVVPGSVCERGPGGELFNTAIVLSPTGQLVAAYRKIFPWRPFEPFTPGDHFVVVDIPDRGRVGLSICYDAWFPEVGRHLAWYGADVVLNLVKTTTADREQELVLARANSIVNQVFTVSVNAAGPLGVGKSLIVDPEGAVVGGSPDQRESVVVVALDLDHVKRVRAGGTAGLNRMWSQFRPDDAPLDLPLYAGRIDPDRWSPRPSSIPTQEPILKEARS